MWSFGDRILFEHAGTCVRALVFGVVLLIKKYSQTREDNSVVRKYLRDMTRTSREHHVTRNRVVTSVVHKDIRLHVIKHV